MKTDCAGPHLVKSIQWFHAYKRWHVAAPWENSISCKNAVVFACRGAGGAAVLHIHVDKLREQRPDNNVFDIWRAQKRAKMHQMERKTPKKAQYISSNYS